MGGRVHVLGRLVRREAKAIAIVAVVVLAAALVLSPSTQSLADGDGYLGFAEFLVYPLSLGLALALMVVGRRGTVIVGAALLAAAGLTICQPFGAVVRGHVPPAAVDAGTLVPNGQQVAYWSWFPPLRIAAYRRDTTSLADGSGGEGDALARTWIVPGLLDNSTRLAWQEGISAVLLVRLQDGGYAAVTIPDDSGEPHTAYRLGLGIASKSGVVYWLAAAGIIALGVARRRQRRRRAAAPAAAAADPVAVATPGADWS